MNSIYNKDSLLSESGALNLNKVTLKVLQEFYQDYIMPSVYHYKIEDNKALNIIFREKHFSHLIGFQYFSNLKGYDAWEDISKNNYTPMDIRRANPSEYRKNVRDRIQYFHKLHELLREPNIIEFDGSKTKRGSALKGDYILYNKTLGLHLNFSMGKELNSRFYPETYIVTRDDYFIDNQEPCTIHDKRVFTREEYLKYSLASNVERDSLDRAKKLINKEPTLENIEESINFIQGQNDAILREIKDLENKKDVFVKAKGYVEKINECQSNFHKMNFFSKVLFRKKYEEYKNTIKGLEDKLLKECDIDSYKDFDSKLKVFEELSAKKLKGFKDALASNKLFLRTLYEAKNTVKTVEHKYIIHLYKDEVASALNLDSKTTYEIIKLLKAEGKYLKHSELLNYQGEHGELVESILRGIHRASRLDNENVEKVITR